MDPFSTWLASIIGAMLFICLLDLGVSAVALRAAVAAVNGVWRSLTGSAKEPKPGSNRKAARGKSRTAAVAVPDPTVGQALRVSLVGIFAQLAAVYLSGAAGLSGGLTGLILLVRVSASIGVIPLILGTTVARAALVALFDTLIRFALIGGVAMLVASLVSQQ